MDKEMINAIADKIGIASEHITTAHAALVNYEIFLAIYLIVIAVVLGYMAIKAVKLISKSEDWVDHNPLVFIGGTAIVVAMIAVTITALMQIPKAYKATTATEAYVIQKIIRDTSCK